LADHARSDNPAVQAQLDRFAQLSPGRDILGLERITALLATLGNPQDRLPPVFHVAGTNGKGSTCAFLRAILEAAGLKVHVYTSPHLVRFNERIRVAGKLIEDEDLAPLLSEVLNRAEAYDIGPSFFEATTAAAFLAFSRTPADACIVEVGLGGRLDATNVVKPIVCGIASLGLDHESFLLAPEDGVPPMPDLERIAFEKAGIAKTGVPLVSQAYPAPVQRRIEQEAAYKMASYLPRGELWDAIMNGDGLHYRDMGGEVRLPLPRMVGAHQADNAALAIAMIRHQEVIEIPEAALATGLTSATWPARFQRLSNGPLTKGRAVWIDGAHNPAAATVLASELSKRPMHLVLGILANKDEDGIIAPLKPHALSLTFVEVPDHASHNPETLAEKWGGRVAADLPDALFSLDDKILIVGSLYLAGVALKLNEELPD
jgi:dihydrofolate synthase / folylpolyglutamate synthase